ncbi:MAG: hypothetical protein QOG42_96 [Solirubrobacteraceae bacterium]|nr:hypothetical protein [Solirubrobacteraceae bacterium]
MTTHRLSVDPPIPRGVVMRPRLRRIAFPLDERHCRHTATVADALRIGLAQIGCRSGDEILVPVYGSAATRLALSQAGIGARPYAGTTLLEPDADELEALLTPAVRALYLVHPLGFAQDCERWRAWCDRHGLLLIEDATHAIGAAAAGRPVGTLADMAVFGLAACLGMPDGALLRLTKPPAEGIEAAGTVATGLLWRLADERIAARRRAHYAQLLEQLGDRVPAPFQQLPDGASPYALPLAPGRDDRLLTCLADRGVQALAGWPAPGDALLLPVHQELRPRDLERIAAATITSRPRRVREELTLEPLAGFDALAGDWARLAEAASSIFATPQWLGTWWRHYGSDGALRLHACRDRAGRVVAILPLEVRAAGPLRVVRFAGHGPSDQLGPICARADRPAVARAMLRAVDAADADVLLGEQLAGDAGWDALLGGRVLGSEGSPVVHFAADGWEAQLRRWTPSIGRQLKRHTRKLERSHEITTRRTENACDLQRDLDSLFALHDARWGAGQTAFGGRDAAFHREFAAIALAHGWLELTFLEIDGVPVSATYNLRYGGAEYQYQSGRLPEWDHGSVGTIALVRSIRSACEDGLSECRFLRGDEDYKYLYADADPRLQTIAVARRRGAAGALAVAHAVPRHLLKPARRWVAAT